MVEHRRLLEVAAAAAVLLRSLPAQILQTTRAKANSVVQQQQLYEEDEQGQVWLLVPFEGRVHRASPSLPLSLAGTALDYIAPISSGSLLTIPVFPCFRQTPVSAPPSGYPIQAKP